MLNLFGGNVIYHHSGRLHIFPLLILVQVLPGSIGNCADNAGNGDLHGAEKGDNSGHPAENIGHHISAGPTQQHGKASAQHASGDSLASAEIKILYNREAPSQRLILNRQMINAAAQENKYQHTYAAHGYICSPSECMDYKKI